MYSDGSLQLHFLVPKGTITSDLLDFGNFCLAFSPSLISYSFLLFIVRVTPVTHLNVPFLWGTFRWIISIFFINRKSEVFQIGAKMCNMCLLEENSFNSSFTSLMHCCLQKKVTLHVRQMGFKVLLISACLYMYSLVIFLITV